jgi:murein DD-endopeptidase MepM/ murein hydrolase activator NlpD
MFSFIRTTFTRTTVRRAALPLVALALVLAAPAPAAAGATCLMPPVLARVAVPFRAPACRWCPGQRGLEYANRAGAAVRAAGAGTVVFAGPVAGAVWVTVDHGGDMRSSYGPLRRVVVRRGASVAAGTVIATAAAALHFGVRVGGRYVDPAPMIGQPVHLVPRLLSPTGAVPRPPPVRCAGTVASGSSSSAGS